jgi:hypothetical protein
MIQLGGDDRLGYIPLVMLVHELFQEIDHVPVDFYRVSLIARCRSISSANLIFLRAKNNQGPRLTFPKGDGIQILRIDHVDGPPDGRDRDQRLDDMSRPYGILRPTTDC